MAGLYERKVNRDFAKCKTAKEARKLIAEYEKWNDYIEDAALGLGAGATLGFFALMAYLGKPLTNLDKAAHFGKGFGTSWLTGKGFNKLYQWWHRDKINTADDDILETLKSTVPRVAAEGGVTFGEAVVWEVAQKNIPQFPGSVYDEWDIFADGVGHVGWSIGEYVNTWRRNIQHNAYVNCLKQLNKKPTKKRSLVTGFGGASFRYDSDLSATA